MFILAGKILFYILFFFFATIAAVMALEFIFAFFYVMIGSIFIIFNGHPVKKAADRRNRKR